MIRIVCGYGINVSAGDIAFLAMGQPLPLIIGAFLLSTDYVTYYTIGASLQGYALSILGTVVFVLTPAVSKWQAAGNDMAIRALLHAMQCDIAVYFIVPIKAGLLIFGHSFGFALDGTPLRRRRLYDADDSFLPLLLSAIGLISSRILQGVGKVRPLAHPHGNPGRIDRGPEHRAGEAVWHRRRRLGRLAGPCAGFARDNRFSLPLRPTKRGGGCEMPLAGRSWPPPWPRWHG